MAPVAIGIRRIVRRARAVMVKYQRRRSRPPRRSPAEVRRGLIALCDAYHLKHRWWLRTARGVEEVRAASRAIVKFATVHATNGTRDVIIAVLKEQNIPGILRHRGLKRIITVERRTRP